VPPDEALADLERQLAEGSSLLAVTTVGSAQELEDFRGRFETWREATTEGLRRMFDRRDHANRFSAASAAVRIFSVPAGGFMGGYGTSWSHGQDEFNRLHTALRRGRAFLEGLRDLVRQGAVVPPPAASPADEPGAGADP
jgi:hypothetical protein